MIHDELLAKINEECVTTYEDATGNVPMSPRALRAVVELHKPILLSGGKHFDDEFSLEFCGECADDDIPKGYPCPTIQAIEEILK